jgi:signal transduction histidine kinase
VYPVADNDYATIAFALGLVALSTRRYWVAWGTERRARLAAMTASIAFGIVLVWGAATRIADVGGGRTELWAYDLSVFLIAVGLFSDLLWGRWTQAAVTGLVIDLGEPGASGTLRDRLARTLGDPTLVLAYRLPEEDRYVDEEGRTIELPVPGRQRVVTPIEENDHQVAALIHDAAVLDDPQLISAVTSATRLAVSNVRLQADVRERVREVEASRRRIVEAGDAQRRRLARELRDGAEQRLARVTDLLADSGEPFAEVRDGVPAAQAELREFARGIRPQALTDHGLRAAIEELAGRFLVPVDLVVPAERFAPTVEAAAYFVCSEALTNAAKYADASRVMVLIDTNGDRLLVDVADDGVGGADPTLGSGLSGLADRVEALGGRFRVDSPLESGTRIHADFPFIWS